MRKWQLQQAKARFSEVVKLAQQAGPQEIMVHGRSVVLIISKKDFLKLKKPKSSLVEFMKKSPLRSIQLKIERDKSVTREIDL